jgi:hypothetical protein
MNVLRLDDALCPIWPRLRAASDHEFLLMRERWKSLSALLKSRRKPIACRDAGMADGTKIHQHARDQRPDDPINAARFAVCKRREEIAR